MRPPAEMIGLIFGCLKVIDESIDSSPKNKKFVAECIYCGAKKTALGGNIRKCSKSTSGGCSCQERYRSNRKSNINDWKNKFYGVWDGMMRRCYVQTHVAFHRYGGRGIYVCDEWQSISNFFSWAESQVYEKGWQLDRIDNDKGYSPLNCRFTSPITNANNKINNRKIIVNGIEYSIAEASRKFSLNKTTIKERLNRGWSHEDSVRPV